MITSPNVDIFQKPLKGSEVLVGYPRRLFGWDVHHTMAQDETPTTSMAHL